MKTQMIRNAIPEIGNNLNISKEDLLILKAARGICMQIRQLTIRDVDDDNVWSDAYLALNTALESYVKS